jgi:hypothetical protein
MYGHDKCVENGSLDGEQKQNRLRMLAGLISGLVFYLVLICILATALAQVFGVFHVLEKAKIEVTATREIQEAWLQSPTCRSYFNTISDEERRRYDKANKISSDNCKHAMTVLNESEFTQRVAFFMNHYAACETDKCLDLLKSSILNISLFSLPALCLFMFLTIIYFFMGGGAARQHSLPTSYVQLDPRMLPLLASNYHKKDNKSD